MNQELATTQKTGAMVIPGDGNHISLAQQLTAAEIDQQIATAHAFPRNRSLVAQGIAELATWSPEAAAECNYALPRGGKSLTGPSIRLAEIIAAEFGNCRVGARVVHVDRFEGFLEAEAVFHDLEKNTASQARVRRSIKDRQGRVFKDDMIAVAGQAACSIAKRNAVLAGVPKALWMPAYYAALQVIKGDAKTLTERREGALRALGAFGVTPDMICGALEIGGPLDIGLDHMPTLLAWHKALKDGEGSVESLFPAPAGGKSDDQATQKRGTNAKLDEIAKEGQAAAKPSAEAAPAEPGEQPLPDPDEEQEPSPKALNAAYDKGAEARRKGLKKEACPPAYRDSQHLFDAWNEGWETAA